MNFTDNIKMVVGIISAGVAFITFIISTYVGYNDVLIRIDDNMGQIEKTQMMFLKKEVRGYERKKCSVSDAEWDEYIENYSSLYELKKKYKYISTSTPWKPIIRITEETEDQTCKK